MSIPIKEMKKKLINDINVIVKIITENKTNSLISIILYGSYGRSEGAFYQEGELVLTYNDYDLILVVNKLLSKNEIERIKENLQNNLDIKWIDISQKTIPCLKNLKPTIFNFDLKYGSKIIWGDENVLDFIPTYTPDQLTLRDAEILYFTRLYTFLGSLKHDGFVVGVEGEESRFFRNQMAKAVLAITDVLLLQKKAYHTSYRERVDRLAKLYPLKKELIELSRWALREKMAPNATTMSSVETMNLYKQVLGFYHMEMYIALSKYYSKKIESTEDLFKAKLYSFQELVSRIKTLLLAKSLKPYNIRMNKLIVQSYAVESFVTEGIEKERTLNKCKTHIKKIDSTLNVEDISWDALRELIVKLSR